MDQVHTYRIEVHGRVDERELNAAGPLRVRVEAGDEGRSRLTAHTDQSGLVGLVRHLHGRGFVLLAVERAGEGLGTGDQGSGLESRLQEA
ncbi:MAG: hypothetical protein ACLFU8_16655 [Anaerolineales bacterium]